MGIITLVLLPLTAVAFKELLQGSGRESVGDFVPAIGDFGGGKRPHRPFPFVRYPDDGEFAGIAREELEVALSLGEREFEDSAAPMYNPLAQSWGELPPAVITRSSDNCVGYCFHAIIESVSKNDQRVARVVVLEEGRGPTRAIVHSSSAAYEGKPVRFTCFDASYAGTVPRFEDCEAR